MDERPLDAKELLQRVKNGHRSEKWKPLAPSDELVRWREWPMRSEASLDYLHRHWALPDSFAPEAGGGGIKGRVVNAFSRLTFRVLGPYLREERELLANLVRTVDALAKRSDALALEITGREEAEAENAAQLGAWLSSKDTTTGLGDT